MVANQKFVKKIEIKKTNNNWFKTCVDDYFKTNSVDTKSLDSLQKYVNKRTTFIAENELSQVLEIMNWVSSQWEHDGLNEPSKGTSALQILKNVHQKRARYRCVEYGLVLSEVLKAFGFISRSISLRSINVAYGGFGSGHVASEVWVNDLCKWVFVDPQFCICPFHNGKPLNYLEMFKLKKRGLFGEIDFRIPAPYQKLRKIKLKTFAKEYRDFIHEYFGYVGVKIDGFSSGASLNLLLEAKKQFMTFQGFEFNNAVFTGNPDDLYFTMNRSLIIFSYQSEDSTFFDRIKALNIKTEEQYFSKMHLFAAKPEFNLKFMNNAFCHSHYLVRIDNGNWQRNDSSKMKWTLNDGRNKIEVRSVNQRGLAGPITFSEISYC